MKQKLCLFLLSSTMLVGCIKETKTVTKETNPYDVPECVRTNTCTTGGYTGGTGGGGGGTQPGTNPPYVGTIPYDPNWGDLYPGLSKNLTTKNNCSSSYATESSLYETRKVTVTAGGDFSYDPTLPDIGSFTNTSIHLKSLERVQELLTTDAMLKIRFKVKPEPKSAGFGNEVCYKGPSGGSASFSKGYTKLSFAVKIYGITPSGSTEEVRSFFIEPTTVNHCTKAIDLKNYKQMYPRGIYFTISQISSNTQFVPDDYDKNGFYSMDVMTQIPGTKCWSMDIEVAADGTKTFD
ncbi:MAG: hypothetical protein WCY48_10870 [Candidatus Caldatribacteriota bacterium]